MKQRVLIKLDGDFGFVALTDRVMTEAESIAIMPFGRDEAPEELMYAACRAAEEAFVSGLNQKAEEKNINVVFYAARTELPREMH